MNDAVEPRLESSGADPGGWWRAAPERSVFSLRFAWTLPGSWVVVLLAPVLLVIAVNWIAAAQHVGGSLEGYTCLASAHAATLKVIVGPDGTGALTAASAPPVSHPATFTPGSFGAAGANCADALAQKFDETSKAAMNRARGLATLAFILGAIVSGVLALYCLVTVGRFCRCSTTGQAALVAAGTALAAGVVASVAAQWPLLPHRTTLDLLALLSGDPEAGPKLATHATQFCRCGSWLLVFTGVLYVAAQAAVANVDFGRLGNAAHVVELSRRFERLTTLSTWGSIAFALAILTVISLLSWPLAFDDLGPEFGEAATTIYGLFGLNLTVLLAAGYLPAAAILEAAASKANPNTDLADRRDWLDKRGLTVVTTARVAASVATLIPLIAGALTSASGAQSVISAAIGK